MYSSTSGISVHLETTVSVSLTAWIVVGIQRSLLFLNVLFPLELKHLHTVSVLKCQYVKIRSHSLGLEASKSAKATECFDINAINWYLISNRITWFNDFVKPHKFKRWRLLHIDTNEHEECDIWRESSDIEARSNVAFTVAFPNGNSQAHKLYCDLH